jgi:hypothetical protein
MKRTLIAIILILALFPAFATAAEAGTGISIFIPESLYLHGRGTVSLETGFSTSIGLGKFFEVPIGFSYNKIQGYMVEGAETGASGVESTAPWFMGDSLLPYIKLQAKLPIGPVTLKAFAGAALNWNASLTPFEANISKDIAAENEFAVFTSFDYENKLGYGILAGASLGVTIDPVTLRIFGEYRSLKAPLEMSGDYRTGPAGAITTPGSLDGSNAELVIRGITLGIGGSFAF